LNAAYDSLLTARSAASGRDRRMTRLIALLNQANLVTEAAAALDQERNQPPEPVTATVESVADAIGAGHGRVIDPPPWGTSAGALLLGRAHRRHRLETGLRLSLRAGAAAGNRHHPRRRARRGDPGHRALRAVAVDSLLHHGGAAAVRAEPQLWAAHHLPHPAG